MTSQPATEPRTQLKTLSSTLRKLHKTLVDVETKRFGEPGNAFEHLQLLTSHPQFAWLRQISEVLVDIDERLDDKEQPVDSVAVESVRKTLDGLLSAENSGEFRQKYLEALQASTDVAIAHGELRKRLTQLAPAS